jgi:hypothetical protein
MLTTRTHLRGFVENKKEIFRKSKFKSSQVTKNVSRNLEIKLEIFNRKKVYVSQSLIEDERMVVFVPLP